MVDHFAAFDDVTGQHFNIRMLTIHGDASAIFLCNNMGNGIEIAFSKFIVLSSVKAAMSAEADMRLNP